jgi:hypothetical protein
MSRGSLNMSNLRKKVTVIGGPFPQQVDPVLQLVPTGKGQLAAAIADSFQQAGAEVERWGNFDGGTPFTFDALSAALDDLATDVVVCLAHLPNILIESSPTKIRLADGEEGTLKVRAAPKLIARIKKQHPQVLLVPFKLADPEMMRVEIVRWMLELHAGLAVYSRLGDSSTFYIIDALANEIAVPKADLPQRLVQEIAHFMDAVRRRSLHQGHAIPDVPHLPAIVDFSRTMQPAFAQIIERNVSSGRFPGNFSFRCTHGFLSSRVEDGFVITRRDVDKTGLTEQDFVFVSLRLENDALIYSGAEGLKPSIDSPVHRLLYEQLPWVKSIVHGHLQAQGDMVHPAKLTRWPCGAENEAYDILSVAPREAQQVWVVNVEGHGFVALIGSDNPQNALLTLSRLEYAKD